MGTGTLPPVRQPARRWTPPDRPAGAAAAFMAFWAYVGALGLAAGGLDPGPAVTARLPLGSPVLAGLALLVVVAVPMTLAAVTAWRGSTAAAGLLVLAGAALVLWIAVEVVIIRTYSWMQPTCLGYGLLVVWLGRRNQRSG